MNGKHKKPDFDAAFGQTVAAVPEMRSLKEEAAIRLGKRQSEDSVVSWLAESVRSYTTDLERLLGMDRSALYALP